jgi:hypothetical protein
MTTLPGETGAGGAPASDPEDGGPVAVRVRGLVLAQRFFSWEPRKG